MPSSENALGRMAPADLRQTQSTASLTRKARDVIQKALLDAPHRCHNCGCELEPASNSVIRRGAITILQSPLRVVWRGHVVPLSPTEAVIVALVVRRGRASYDAIDAAIEEFGSRPQSRAVLLWRIRCKFAALGARYPFEQVSAVGLRFLPELDEQGSVATVIGLREGFA